MSISLLMVLTAITGLIYSLARIQREYFSTEVLDTVLAIALISAAVFFSALVNKFVARSFNRSNKRAPSHVLKLIISAIFYALFAILILKFVYGQNISALLAATAALTVGLAWGLREPIGHLFSGLVLEIERPWAVGDYVKFNEQIGQIEALKWRSVYVRTIYDSLLVLPNSLFANNVVEVFPRNKVCLHFIDVGIQNDVSPSKVLRAATEVIAKDVPLTEYCSDNRVQVTGTNSMTGTVNYRIYFATKDVFQVDVIKTVIVERLWHALGREGIFLRGFNQNMRVSHYADERRPGETGQIERIELRSKFLRTIAAFREVEAEALNLLAGNLELVSYGIGERVRVHRERPDSLFILLQGRLGVQYLGKKKIEAGTSKEDGARVISVYPDALHWNKYLLREVEKRLTEVLGPVARLLVENEARFTDDLYDLYRRLGSHIDDERERQAFLEHGPRSFVRELEAGDGLCGMADEEKRLGKRRVVALEETELLELTSDNRKVLVAKCKSLAYPLEIFAEDMKKLVLGGS